MSNRCEKIEVFIESFFDGETNKKENREIQRHIKVCSKCRKLVAKNQEITDFLSHLPEFECPGPTVDKILGTIKIKTAANVKYHDYHVLFNWRSALVGIAFSAAIVFLIIRPFPKSNIVTIQPSYSVEDIEKARREAAWSLAFINNRIKISELKAVKEVFYKSLPKTVIRSLERSVPILFGGAK